MRRILLVAVCAALWPLAALAGNVAHLVVNERYHAGGGGTVGGRVERMADMLRDAGWSVELERDASGDRLARRLAAILRDAGAARGDDRVVVVLAGAFAALPGGTWFLGVDTPADHGPAQLLGHAMPLDPVLAVLARRPAAGALFLVDGVEGPRPGRGVSRLEGLPEGIPDTVFVARGRPGAIERLLIAELVTARQSWAEAARRLGDAVQVGGFVSPVVGLMPDPGEAAGARSREQARDDGFWEAVQVLGTAGAFRAYLDRYPEGRHHQEARRALQELADAPRRAGEAAERALGLDRETRRRIQTWLDRLGYEAGPADGIFGRATRAAIRAWQADEGFEPTGYLTGEQFARLRRQAAERRRLEAERDDAFWRITGARGTVSGLRRYLERYPEGRHAEEARRRLEDLLGPAWASGEEEAWRAAREEDSWFSYARYLRRFPDGLRAAEARRRQEEILARQRERDRAEERAAPLNPIVMLLVEQRLKLAGLDPGRVDGVIDSQTRRAVAEWQRRHRLVPTGYLSDETRGTLLGVR